MSRSKKRKIRSCLCYLMCITFAILFLRHWLHIRSDRRDSIDPYLSSVPYKNHPLRIIAFLASCENIWRERKFALCLFSHARINIEDLFAFFNKRNLQIFAFAPPKKMLPFYRNTCVPFLFTFFIFALLSLRFFTRIYSTGLFSTQSSHITFSQRTRAYKNIQRWDYAFFAVHRRMNE